MSYTGKYAKINYIFKTKLTTFFFKIQILLYILYNHLNIDMSFSPCVMYFVFIRVLYIFFPLRDFVTSSRVSMVGQLLQERCLLHRKLGSLFL